MEGSPPNQSDGVVSIPAADLFGAFSVLELPRLKRRISEAMQQGQSEKEAVSSVLSETAGKALEAISKDEETKPGWVTERTARLIWSASWLRDEIQRLGARKPGLTVLKGGR